MRPDFLPDVWRTALDTLRPAPMPDGEPPPVDLSGALADLRSQLTVRLGWEALQAQARHEPIPDTARRWGRTAELVRQTLKRAQRQLQWLARNQTEGQVLWAWAADPRVVSVPDQDEAWAVLLMAIQGGERQELRTLQLTPGRWALYRGEAPYTFRNVSLPAGAYLSEQQTAEQLGLSPALLAAVWPFTGVQRLQGGHYASVLDQWSSGHWLNALVQALTTTGHSAWDERLLLRAYRALPAAPDVQDGTLRAALRRSPHVVKMVRAGVWAATTAEVLEATQAS